MSLAFINIIEPKIIDTDYNSSILKDEITSYYWSKKNIILDVLMKENICAIKNNEEVTWYSLNESNIENVTLKICSIVI